MIALSLLFIAWASRLTVEAGAGSWYVYQIRPEGEQGYMRNCTALCASNTAVTAKACLSSHHSAGSYPSILDGLYDNDDTHPNPLKFTEHFTYSVAANNKPVSVKTNSLSLSPPHISIDVAIPKSVNATTTCGVSFDPIDPDESIAYMRFGVCCCGVSAGALTGCEWKASPSGVSSATYRSANMVIAILVIMGGVGLLYVIIPVIRRKQQGYTPVSTKA